LNHNLLQAPFGRRKENALGQELGHFGQEAYLEMKHIRLAMRGSAWAMFLGRFKSKRGNIRHAHMHIYKKSELFIT
jgi:diadenosine tetraphosphate (Ap4A) HIT family hydrolase